MNKSEEHHRCNRLLNKMDAYYTESECTCVSHISTNTQIMKNYAGLKSSTRIMKMDDIIFFQQHSVF